jgi:hypothetical protein
MIDVLKKIAIVGLVLGAASALGNAINSAISWTWLVYVFKIFRVLLNPMDFVFDTTTLITVLGKMLSTLILVWGFYGFIYVMRVFNSKS